MQSEIPEKPMTKEDFDRKVAELRNRTDLSPAMRKIFYNSLVKRYGEDKIYRAPDKNGFSQADYDAREAAHQELVKKAIKLGMDKVLAANSNDMKLNLYIDRKLREGKPLCYDESELGSPNFDKYDGTDYR